MISTIRQILEITKEVDLTAQFGDFEDGINATLAPLQTQLSKDVRSVDVPILINHMTDVERWRERSVRFLALASAFESHCKSDVFLLPKGKGVTDFDRTAYQRKLTSGFTGLVIYLEGVIYCLDSRVNLCKKLLGLEDGGFSNKIRN